MALSPVWTKKFVAQTGSDSRCKTDTDDALALALGATNSIPDFFAVVPILSVVTIIVLIATAIFAICHR